jgi:serine/threonine protein kinase
MRPFGKSTAEHILREIKALEGLCRDRVHANIVAVLKHGILDRGFYFLDMELCELSLDNYIQMSWTQMMKENVPHLTSSDLPPKTKTSHVWEIMEDITQGVAFIHQRGWIHRDLKPRNGLTNMIQAGLTNSTLCPL